MSVLIQPLAVIVLFVIAYLFKLLSTKYPTGLRSE
ncbi:MAG: hypothetical protein JWN03_4902 [Nocardia sp.]|nr:hypothetical protein [Nocardia sp.]